MIIKFLHIALAVFLFFSTTGLTINSHFCTGKFKYSALFVQPADCCDEVNEQTLIEHSCKDEASQTPCCQNKTSFLKSFQNQELTDTSFQEVEMPTFKIIISSFNSLDFSKYQWLSFDYLNYKPPLISKNISILFQIFLC